MAEVRHLGLFPWCFDQETAFFKNSDIPNKAVPIWWRVKKWKLEIKFVKQFNTDPITVVTYDFSQEFSVTDLQKNVLTEEKFNTEKDLVCAGVFYTPEFSNRLPADHFWGIDAPELFIDSYIKIGPSLDFYFDQDDMIGAGSIGEGDRVGEIQVKMHGLEFTVPLRLFLQTDSGENLNEIVSLNGTLTATEYWEYDPNDGKGPIYDSTSGRKLRKDRGMGSPWSNQ